MFHRFNRFTDDAIGQLNQHINIFFGRIYHSFFCFFTGIRFRFFHLIGYISKTFFTCFITFNPGNFYQPFFTQFNYAQRIFWHIIGFFLFNFCLTCILEMRLYPEYNITAVFGYHCIVATVNNLLCLTCYILYYQFAIAFLRINGINNIFAIVTNHTFIKAFPAIVNIICERFFLGKYTCVKKQQCGDEYFLHVKLFWNDKDNRM